MKIAPLSDQNPEVRIQLGDMVAIYWLRRYRRVEWLVIPHEAEDHLCSRPLKRPMHPSFRLPDSGVQGDSGPGSSFNDGLAPGLTSWNGLRPDSLVQVALRGAIMADAWRAGMSMRNGCSTEELDFLDQQITHSGDAVEIRTRLRSPSHFEIEHIALWQTGDTGLQVRTIFHNTGNAAHELEMLSSFSLNNLSPFAPDDAPERLRLHRFRSAWSAEGRHEATDIEDLHLERSWGGNAVGTAFHQTGSLPVRGFFPFVALEDKPLRVFWGAQLVWHGSWQIEIQRHDDGLNISGGHGDFDHAHWMKRVQPGSSFEAPLALVSSCCGDFDTVCSRLVDLQSRLAHPEPAQERELPIIFNEWCSTWGRPTHDYLVRTADRLAQTQTRYLVIDDGWAEKPKGADIQHNGDWNLNTEAFPHGLAATTAAIRSRGLIPGIWFEFEPCTQGTDAFELVDHHLHRHGKVIQVGRRHFWDFRDPFTFDYLTQKVINLLRDNDFGYLKVDYNESIGVGCDGAESLGEGLRQHLVKVKEFFALIRKEVPGIVIENCASGGHRLEPGMIALTSMSSFSDAHEGVEIPIIAANLHRLIPVHKNQVWAVLRADDSEQRLQYSLAATFLGRMCISGDLVDLSDERLQVIQEAHAFYQQIVPILRDGTSRILACTGKSWRYPTGWQALVRTARNGETALVVVHAFANAPTDGFLSVDLHSSGNWNIKLTFGQTALCKIRDGKLLIPALQQFTAAAFLIERS